MSNEKNHINPLDNPEMKKNIFEVPDGYFDQFEANIKARLEAESGESKLNDHLKAPVFEVPEGYFDQLEDKIKARVAEDASLLGKEEKLNIPPFEAPEGYFEGFEAKLKAKLTSEEQAETAKVIPLYQRNWFRLAVAAVLVIGFFLLRSAPPPDGYELTDDTALAFLVEEDISLDMIASLDGFDMAIEEILEEETADYDFDLGLNPELDYEFEYIEQ